MAAPARARRVARFADIAATVLLALPAVVLAWDYAPPREFAWFEHDSNFDLYAFPRLVVVLVALAAAVLLRRRHGRAAGVALGAAAVLASSVSVVCDEYLYWDDYGALGADWGKSAVWIGLTGTALLLVPRRVEPVPARLAASALHGATRFVPRVLPAVAGASLLALAWAKVESLGDMGCSSKSGRDRLDTDILLTTAHIWAALLVLVPGTRRHGLRFAVLLFEGTAAWMCSHWIRFGTKSDSFVGLGAVEGEWPVHIALSVILAVVFVVAYLRELHVHALQAFARYDCLRPRSRMPALFVRFHAFRRTHREIGARLLWAAPIAAALLGGGAILTLSRLTRDVLVPFAHDGASRMPAADAVVVLAAVQFFAAAWLLRAATRARGATVGLAAIAMEAIVNFTSEPFDRTSDAMPLLVATGATGLACILSMWGVRETDSIRMRAQLERAAESLRAFSQRLFSTQ